jgi:hypothetical protein
MCHCLIRHPQNAAERKVVAEELKYARSIGDTQGIMIRVAQLTGRCPERDETEKK